MVVISRYDILGGWREPLVAQFTCLCLSAHLLCSRNIIQFQTLISVFWSDNV